ncbi:SDR family oxidoreductase [Pikeienuella sp. HZG-20]|uniref:SDR family oxidoreductase n=1 Tax=Paludibacillus litoralis TaxID=3133267 RepID=UPI0030EDD72B
MAKTALITGAGSGIGRATARALAAKGWRVALVGRRRDALEETAAEIGEGALVAPGDIAKADDVERIFVEVATEFGRLDLLFNNAGRGSPVADIDEMTLDDWYGVLDANLNGSVLCARAAFALMKRQDPKGGRIINNGSISAYAPRPGSVAYTVTKHAITGLTRSLSLDGRKHGIACGQIDIGNALTEMAARMVDGVPQADGSIKAEAVMDPDHVAAAVAQMAEYPLETNVLFQTIMATNMPFVGRG